MINFKNLVLNAKKFYQVLNQSQIEPLPLIWFFNLTIDGYNRKLLEFINY